MHIKIFVKPEKKRLMTYRRRWNKIIKIEDEMCCSSYGVTFL